MSMLINRLKQLLSSSSNYSTPQSNIVVQSVSQAINPYQFVDKIIFALKQVYDLPTPDRVIYLRNMFDEIAKRYGKNTYYSILNTVKSKLFNTPYVYVLNYVLSRDDPGAVVKKIMLLKQRESLSRELGLSKEELEKIIKDRNALKQIVADKITSRINTLIGISNQNKIDIKTIKTLIQDIHRTWNRGIELLGDEMRDIVPYIIKMIKKTSPTKINDPKIVLKIMKGSIKNDVKTVYNTLLSLRGKPVIEENVEQLPSNIRREIHEKTMETNKEETSTVHEKEMKRLSNVMRNLENH